MTGTGIVAAPQDKKAALKVVEDKLILPEACENSTPSWFGYLLTCREGVDRNSVVTYLEEHGVQTRMLFAGNLTKHPCFDQMRASGEGDRIVGDLVNTDRIMYDTFGIGVYPGMTEEMLEYIARMIKEAVSSSCDGSSFHGSRLLCAQFRNYGVMPEVSYQSERSTLLEGELHGS